ncbi:hypothetical protein F0562_032600 [Nyssa sinensis]|uniref:RING-type E3 ubiquitin transferase n=1 Tax=Nyssa sinensis TaxID=561372 RepID=A0A5J5AQI2_9ASTE|nr:hypothetical protein F0562_032600 [Nyssa sinensis]
MLGGSLNYTISCFKEGAAKKITFLFQCVTWKLEKALGNLSRYQFDISEEVQEQVELVRAQLRRATERYGGPLNSTILSRALSQPLDKEIDLLQSGCRVNGSLHVENLGNIDHEVKTKVDHDPRSNGLKGHSAERPSNSSASSEVCLPSNFDAGWGANSGRKSLEEDKKPDSPMLPDDFLCPISLELMRDPVIVATGQTYERSYIQRWMDCGNKTCPKTQQKLKNLTHQIMSMEERSSAVAEIRSLSKRSTDNRILIAEAGAIPVLVNLLTTEDSLTQENAVTSILNLSIHENSKGLIMLAGAIPSIVQVLKVGSMEARENAAATLFSLSLADENKVIIGASGAIPALVELLLNGSTRGKKDAAIALFNLCIYQGNKGRAVRAGIITALLKILTDLNSCMLDEALTILFVLSSHQEAKVAIVKASTIPVLIDIMRRGLPRNKENAAAILLSLCKRDMENLACISRLGAVIPLTELAKSGTERAKQKATSLLEHLRKLQQL